MSRDNEERDDAVGVESVQKGHLQESPQPRKQDQLQTVAFAWKNFGQQLLIMQQLGEAHTGFPPSTTVQATPACLIPFGHEKPLKIATSGWRRSTGGAEGTLDGERWTVSGQESRDELAGILTKQRCKGPCSPLLCNGRLPPPMEHPRHSKVPRAGCRQRRALSRVPRGEEGKGACIDRAKKRH